MEIRSTHYMTAGDEVEAEARPSATGAVDASPFLGTWVTTNGATRGIVKIIVTSDADGLNVETFGACQDSPCEWGKAKAAVFAEGATSRRGLAFSAFYDFGFMETHLQAKIKKGVLVVAGFNRFKDQSARSNYFSREFFYRV